MVLANTRELRDGQKKFLDLARTQTVYIKRGREVFELKRSKRLNPSPSGDKFYDDPNVVEELDRRLNALDETTANLIAWREARKDGNYGV